MSYINVNEPTMNELIHWFLVNYPVLASDMKNCYHEVQTDEPNPYHIEGDIFAHTMMVCLRAENDNSSKIAKITALLHDIGKPEARDIIPFEAKKPVHSESNEIRNDGKFDGKTSGMQRTIPKSGLKTHFRGHESISFYRAIEIVNALETEGVLNRDEKIQVLKIISKHGSLFDSINTEGNMRKPEKVFEQWVSKKRINDFIQLQQVSNQ